MKRSYCCRRAGWRWGDAVGAAAWAPAANEDGHVENVDKIDHDGETGADAPFHPTTASANRFVDFSPDSFPVNTLTLYIPNRPSRKSGEIIIEKKTTRDGSAKRIRCVHYVKW